MSRTFHFLFSLSPSLLFGLQPVAAQLLPIITKIANGNSVDATTTNNQDGAISNASSKNMSTSINFKNMPIICHKVSLWFEVTIWLRNHKVTASYLKSGSKVPLSDCSTDGKEMIKLLNDYRQENGLPAIQKSCSLCTVANTKVDGTSWFENSIAIDSHFKGCIYQWHWSLARAQLDWSVCLRLWPSEESWLHVEETLPDYWVNEVKSR